MNKISDKVGLREKEERDEDKETKIVQKGVNWPSHLTLLVSRLYPMGHSQRKEPSVLMHWPLMQGSLRHSSISKRKKKNINI